MRFSQPIKLGLAIVAVGAAVFLVWRAVGGAAPASVDAPEGTLWLCQSQGCGREFTITTKDLGAFYSAHPDALPPCPACGKSETSRAVRCSGCHKAIVPPARSVAGAGTKARVCPHCGKPVR
jgi:NAD-dependent SIR2 family protein deacetylase